MTTDTQDLASPSASPARTAGLPSHLAGALGKPVLLLDRADNCWRWGHGREDSPWYPALRIFRQTRPGDWAESVGCVATALSASVQQWG